MINFIQNFMDLFKNTEAKENKEEGGENQALHKQDRTQLKKTKEPKKPVRYTFWLKGFDMDDVDEFDPILESMDPDVIGIA